VNRLGAERLVTTFEAKEVKKNAMARFFG